MPVKKMVPDKIFKSKKEEFIFFITFFIALSFFVYQHKFFSWDLAVYTLNAKYVYDGFFFEWIRPPLTPFILAIFEIFGTNFAQYAYIVFCTILYFVSLKLFHDKFLKDIKNSEFFYLFSINPFILIFGVAIGTELLSLSLLILFFTFYFSKKSFMFLGLSMLCRYSNIPLLFLVLFSKNIKKIFVGLFIIFLTFLPWLLINFIFTGHALTSLGNYYALNSLEQPSPKFEISLQLLFSHFLLIANISLPFLILGVLFKIKQYKGEYENNGEYEYENKGEYEKEIKNKNRKKEKELSILFFSLAILTFLSYLFSPDIIKQPRFLFNLFLPISYFSVFGINFLLSLKNENLKKFLFFPILFLLLFSSLISFIIMEDLGKGVTNEYRMVETIIAQMDNNCTTSSDLWVYFDWQNKKAVPPPKELNLTETKEPEIFKMVDEGYNILLFKNSESFFANEKFIEEIKEKNKKYVIEDNDKYIWLYREDKCKYIKNINETYIDSLKRFGEFSENFTGCEALFVKFKLTGICRHLKFL